MTGELDRALEVLEGVKRIGPDRYLALCPTHGDVNPSLSVAESAEGKLLLWCFAGCKFEAIIGALDLGPPQTNGVEPPAAPRRRPPEPEILPTEDEIRDGQRRLLSNPDLLARIEQLFGWRASTLAALGIGWDGRSLILPNRGDGLELVSVVRLTPTVQGGPDDVKLVCKAARGRGRHLFPRPEDSTADVWLVEGEKDAISGAELGLNAVAVPGVNGWKSAYARRFVGRRATVCLDCDEQGRAAAEKVAGDLRASGLTPAIVDLDRKRSDGFDLSDLLAARLPIGATG
jgi:hypothetical protein